MAPLTHVKSCFFGGEGEGELSYEGRRMNGKKNKIVVISLIYLQITLYFDTSNTWTRKPFCFTLSEIHSHDPVWRHMIFWLKWLLTDFLTIISDGVVIMICKHNHSQEETFCFPTRGPSSFCDKWLMRFTQWSNIRRKLQDRISSIFFVRKLITTMLFVKKASKHYHVTIEIVFICYCVFTCRLCCLLCKKIEYFIQNVLLLYRFHLFNLKILTSVYFKILT